MCAGSELKDTQGETLSVDGANIDDLNVGKGRFNDNHGKGFFNSLGRVTEAKKIFKAEDCENERHEYYWNKIKAPYIYCKGYLYSDEDHPNAKAAAAIMRNIHREDAPLKMKASVEGGVMARGIKDPTRLARTKIHSVALTFTPANNATLVEPLNLDKSNVDWEEDKQLIKSVMHLAETNVPSFRHIQRHASANTIYENINKIQELAKSVGVEIMINEMDPDTIMEKAVLNKIASNVTKINNLVKAVKGDAYAGTIGATSPGKVKMAQEQKTEQKLQARDKFQQGISQMKMDPTTPAKPKNLDGAPSGTMKVKNAQQVKHTNTLKGHAAKAMKDPQHLNTVHMSLVERGVPAQKARAIVTKIRSHMQEDVKKSDDLEKGDIARAGKNLVLAGALAVGAHQMSPKKDAKIKPEKTREQKVQDHNSKVKNPQYHIDANKNGNIDKKINRKPGSKEKVSDSGYKRSQEAKEASKYLNREIIKQKLKKALTAGYGGAGAPTNLTGGGVIQAESLDDGKTKKTDDFEYISCDNCGHEQVYMKHQVKCRKCRSNFNLNKLEDLI